eukprot:gene23147-30352_t
MQQQHVGRRAALMLVYSDKRGGVRQAALAHAAAPKLAAANHAGDLSYLSSTVVVQPRCPGDKDILSARVCSISRDMDLVSVLYSDEISPPVFAFLESS